MDISPITPDSIIITIVYTILLLWGVWVGVRMVYQGFRRPQELLNPLFGHQKVIYAAPPSDAMPEHVAQPFEWALVVALNVANAIIMLTLIRKYTGPGPGADLLPKAEVQADRA